LNVKHKQKKWRKRLEYSNDIIDLHIHSNASDGSYTPSEIVQMASSMGLKAIAITDHDTIDGSRTALNAGIPSSMDFVTGVEISTGVPSFCQASSSIHMLGYFINLDDKQLNKTLDNLQKVRKERTPQIIQKLNNLGIDICEDDIKALVGERLPGRPHIAEILLKRKVVNSFQEAFDKYLGRNKAAYVEKFRLEPEKAIQSILNAGGIPVLAHPYLLKLKTEEELESLVVYLKELGLMGIEVIYPEHNLECMQLYSNIAEKNDLLITGGTDFHGDYKPGIELGIGNGKFQVDYAVYKKMFDTYQKHFHPQNQNKVNDLNVYQDDYDPQLDVLEKKLNYQFNNKELLRNALQHRSYVNEKSHAGLLDNERLEFLGDAVLNLVIGDLLMKQFPDVNEGDLSRMRATLVNESQLAVVARNLDLQPHLLLGKGEIHTNGREKQSILGDTVEAIIAAVYLDGGFEKGFEFVSFLFSKWLTQISNNDYKSKLQEHVQGVYKETPVYHVIEEAGPDHKKFFKVELVVGSIITSQGSGKSKKIAEQDAARIAYNQLKDEN
jgi:hypothetical protein